MEFLKDAKSLARNPLGIIALFIALIYGFATILLGVSAEKLLPSERIIVIWFVVLFPILVLSVFFRLVTKHHGKLYAPADYKNDESFLSTLTEKQREDKLREEIQAIEPTEEIEPEDEVRGAIAFSRSTDTANSEIKAQPISSIRRQYLLAEKLALRKITEDMGLKFRPQVSFDGGRATAFDGVAITKDSVIALEIKFFRRPFVSPALIRETLYRAVLASKKVSEVFASAEFKLILALVVDNPAEKDISIENQLYKIIKDVPFNVEIKVFNFSQLKAEFPDMDDITDTED